MTAIVGLVEDDGTVWLGGDAGGSTTYKLWVRKDSKVFIQGEFIVGFTGSFRARDILRYGMTMQQPKEGDDLDRFMRTVFIDDIRQAFNKAGYLSKDDGQDGHNSTLLVGVRGRLFIVGSDFQVGEQHDPFAAIGSGQPEAQASLLTTRDWRDPQKRLTEALYVSSYFNPGSVSPPFSFVRTLPWPPRS